MSLHLEREVIRLKKNILSLSGLVEETFSCAVRALKERNAKLARQVIETDQQIDEREVEIEEDCQKVLALHQPVAYDLRYIIAVLKINAELEKIGDAAVNIAERVVFLAEQMPVEIPFDCEAMAGKALQMLRNSLNAMVNADAKLAYSVVEADKEVDAFNREAYAAIELGIQRRPELTNCYIHLLGISRHIERAADHASNIAEDVVYLVEGTIIRHHTEEYRLLAE